MSTPNPSLPPAGWYPDPDRPGATRWWTGTEWAVPTPATMTPARAVTNGFAIAGFIVAILAAGSFLASNQATGAAVIGVVLSVIGASKARALGGVGLQLAWWGIGIGLGAIFLAQIWKSISAGF